MPTQWGFDGEHNGSYPLGKWPDQKSREKFSLGTQFAQEAHRNR
jgi:hypothetical protein